MSDLATCTCNVHSVCTCTCKQAREKLHFKKGSVMADIFSSVIVLFSLVWIHLYMKYYRLCRYSVHV